MKFSAHFKLKKRQAELDFVDIDTERDTTLYVDPYALEIRNDDWSSDCANHIRTFFSEVLDALRQGDLARASELVSHLREPRETFLGESAGEPDGKGVGDEQGQLLLTALQNSEAVETGLLQDLAEAELFIPGVGRDKISDLTTNIIRWPLVQYTQAQCELHNVPLTEVGLAPAWFPTAARWEARFAKLPVIDGKPILLVPKHSVRRKLSLESRDFYDHEYLNFLQAERMSGVGSLVGVLRAQRVTKKQLKADYPRDKKELAKFCEEHPEVLAAYKGRKRIVGQLTHAHFEEGFDEGAFAATLKDALTRLPPGNSTASRYHSLMVGILSFIFYPDLICPTKERPIHKGRKRIDIEFTNAAQDGFFAAMLAAAQTRAIKVWIECKNYSEDVSNEEVDQLSGRFSHTRGWLGFLLCRKLSNRDLAVARCKDTARDGRGYVVLLTDDDVIEPLDLIEQGKRSGISAMLRKRFDVLTT